MSWNERMGLEWLKRIVALLFSLADCAERASTCFSFSRRRTLSALRIAEASAFRSVAGAARQLGAPLPPHAIAAIRDWKFDDDDDDPENALHLAYRFRALAIALAYLVQLAEARDGGTQIGRLDRQFATSLILYGIAAALMVRRLIAASHTPIRAPPCGTFLGTTPTHPRLDSTALGSSVKGGAVVRSPQDKPSARR